MLETLLRFCSVGALLRFCSALLRRFCQSPLSHHPLDSFPPFLISFPRPMPPCSLAQRTPYAHANIHPSDSSPHDGVEGKEIRGEREGDSSPLLTQHSTPDCSSQKEKKKEKKRQDPKPLATKNKSKRTKKNGGNRTEYKNPNKSHHPHMTESNFRMASQETKNQKQKEGSHPRQRNLTPTTKSNNCSAQCPSPHSASSPATISHSHR